MTMKDQLKFDAMKQWAPIGTRIYYTGDMANLDGCGTVTGLREPTRFSGPGLDIKMDDGREFLGVFPASFMPSPGRRFWLLEDWKADRSRRIEEMFNKSRGRSG